MHLAAVSWHHGGALEADFQREYQLDLRQIYTGDLSLRRAARLTQWLPAGSAVGHASGGQSAWSDEVDIGAAIHRELQNILVALGAYPADIDRVTPPPTPDEQRRAHAATRRRQERITARGDAFARRHGLAT